MIEMIFAYDTYIARGDIEMNIEKAYYEFLAEEKAVEVLNVTVASALEDICPDEIKLSVCQLNKQGSISCTIRYKNKWKPEMTFRTDMANIRENFMKVYEKFRKK